MEGPRLREYRDGEAEIGGGGVSKIEAKKNEIQLQGRMNTEIREIQVYIYIYLVVGYKIQEGERNSNELEFFQIGKIRLTVLYL